MRRIELLNAVATIKATLEKSDMYKIISTDKISVDDSLYAFKIINDDYLNYTEPAKEVMRIFGFEKFVDTRFWSELIMGDRVAGNPVTWRTLRFFMDHVEQLVMLLRQDNISYDIGENKIVEAGDYDRELLSVILPEKHGEQSNPMRLIKTLEAVNLLYDAFSTITDTPNSGLSVAAIDSGSDKSFDFLGAANLMQQVKEFIIQIWDRVVFYKERKFAERLQLIEKSLPVLEKIANMEAENKLSPEQAELTRRGILKATHNFLESGAIIPEMNNHSLNIPRALMAPSPKLLTVSSNNLDEIVEEPAPNAASPLDNLSSEEMQKLIEIAKKMSSDSPNS